MIFVLMCKCIKKYFAFSKFLYAKCSQPIQRVTVMAKLHQNVDKNSVKLGQKDQLKRTPTHAYIGL